MLLLHTLTTWGSDVTSLVKFHPMVRREPEGQTDSDLLTPSEGHMGQCEK